MKEPSKFEKILNDCQAFIKNYCDKCEYDTGDGACILHGYHFCKEAQDFKKATWLN